MATAWLCLLATSLVGLADASKAKVNNPGPAGFPPLPVGPPQPAPAYMVDNQGNYFGVAPDKGVLDGPILGPINSTLDKLLHPDGPPLSKRQSDGTFWFGSISHSDSKSPFAPSGYTVYRNVMDYGAKGDGVTDDTAAINTAIAAGNRCGAHCGSTSILYADIYFPPGTYLISSPIVQYYFTTFIGDYNDRPTIKGSSNFTGIALIDDDVYYIGGNGAEWYINQNQFYRGIRNFVLDLTDMAPNNTQAGQTYFPTGIHWQVAQATSLQNIAINMAVSDSAGPATAVGIFMENGSGGFMSDLNFTGGNIGFRAGSQQFTARGLTFTSCLTAISMVWDWGFTWQDITITSCYVALNCTEFGGPLLSTGHTQGTGSVAIVDSTFNAVPYGIITQNGGPTPNIVLDNLYVTNPYGTEQSIVQIAGGAPFLTVPADGDVTIASWAMGLRYTSLMDIPTNITGNITPKPNKAAGLLSSGKYFSRSKPQYETFSASDFIIVTEHGVSNDATGDQSAAINSVLSSAGSSVVFFPAGIYTVEHTVKIPPGTKIVGEVWSQIMGTGSFFHNQASPQVMVQVGEPGDSGTIEISDMLFTVSGPTAGCILMEWNIHESTQGSAGMWDSHFRVGGANGTNLGLSECPAGNNNAECQAASMLLHLTTNSSGYFENVWAWVADHDLDSPLNGGDGDNQAGVPDSANVQVSVFGGRGVLIESQGPSWFYGTASEHSVLYQYQLQGAKDIYLGTMQTETPYFQPTSYEPFTIGTFSGDPNFDTCVANSSCSDAWAFRVQNSTNIYVYSAGLYSFFQDFSTYCNPLEDCQEKLIDTAYSQGLWFYNIFTKGSVEIVSPEGLPPVFQNDSNQLEYTSELSAWLPLALTGADIGGDSGDANTPAKVSILPLPCTTVPPSSTFTMSAACTAGIILLPTSGPNASLQNFPSGDPPVCDEVCDFYRMLTGTCCGINGTIINPIEVPPSVTIPWDIILPSGYTPKINITIPVSGYNSPTGGYSPSPPITSRPTSKASTTSDGGGGGSSPTSHPCGFIPDGIPSTVLGISVPLPTAVTLPAGWCNPHPTPIVIPPHLLPDDPPCFPPRICAPCQDGPCPPSIGPEPDDDGGGDDGYSCAADPSPDPETGRCSNGNFPFWDQATGEMVCDIPDEQVPYYITDCQLDADENYNNTETAIECYLDECDGGEGGFRKRAKIDPACNIPPSYMPGPPPGSGLTCDATFICDTDEWPNVCNNARSAMEVRGASQVLTYQGKNIHLTDRWLDLHGLVRNGNGRLEGGNTDFNRDSGQYAPVGGWGLIGCQVEEYPFGNSIAEDPGPIPEYKKRPTLRLIPQKENTDHGTAIRHFIQYATKYAEGFDVSQTYCVQVTGSNQPDDYCINDEAACKNKCAAAYGPAFILVNQATQEDVEAAEAAGLTNEQRWDTWFDAEPGRIYDHTISLSTLANGNVEVIATPLPPQFAPCTSPCNSRLPNNWPIIAPGQKIYTGDFPNGAWVLSYTVTVPGPDLGRIITVGIPRTAVGVGPANGVDDIWDYPPASPSGFPSRRRDVGEAIHEDNVNPIHYVPPQSNATMSGEGLLRSCSPRPTKLSRRQALGGSWLDPAIYDDVLACPVGDPDVFGDGTYPTWPPGAGTVLSIRSGTSTAPPKTSSAPKATSASKPTSTAKPTSTHKVSSTTTKSSDFSCVTFGGQVSDGTSIGGGIVATVDKVQVCSGDVKSGDQNLTCNAGYSLNYDYTDNPQQGPLPITWCQGDKCTQLSLPLECSTDNCCDPEVPCVCWSCDISTNPATDAPETYFC